jgi:two-component system, OmpR family, heavy metal sensor histidine kinase CusS
MKVNSIRFKSSILFSAILCVILTVFSVSLFHVVKHILYRDIERTLMIKAEKIVSILNAYSQVSRIENDPLYMMQEFLFSRGQSPANRGIIDRLWNADVNSLGLQNDFFKIVDKGGKPILRSSNYSPEIDSLLTRFLPLDYEKLTYADLKGDSAYVRGINYPVAFQSNIVFVLQLVTPMDGVVKILRQLMLAMALGIVCILLMTHFLGSLLAASILKPVGSVIKTAETISHKDLGRRIDVSEADHELRALIDSFNSMLGRLEESFSHISEFSSHVAHELKTPLTIIRGEIELALSGDYAKDEMTEVLETTLGEIDHLIKIVKDLLLLARLDYKPDVFQFEHLELGQFIREIYEHSRVLSSEKKITMRLDESQESLYVEADKVHLRRLFFNIINNAVRYTPDNGTITIQITSSEDTACVAITDTGCGIKESDMKKIFDKFYRVHHETECADAGAGLGLSIAQSIAKAHRGRICVSTSVPVGTTFTVSLPRISSPV